MPPSAQKKKFKRGLGLTFKFSAAVIALILVAMGSVTLVVHFRVREALLSQMRAKGLTVTRGLAGNAAEALVSADRLILADLVDKVIRQEPGILLAALTDAQGTVLAHTDFKNEGKPYALPAERSEEKVAAGSIFSYTVGSEPCLDFAVPILLEGKSGEAKKNLGTAHVVYLLSPLQKTIYQTLTYILFIAAGGVILGVITAFFLVRRITQPVRRLAQAAETIGHGDLDQHVTVRSRDELGQLAATFNQMTANLKQAQADLIIKERLQHEMEVAREIQGILIPKNTPEVPGYSIGMMYRGAEEVSGDYIDFIPVKGNRWGMVVADVSGKGVPGGLVMAQTRSTLRTIAQEHPSPKQVLSLTQRKLYGDIRPDMFVTASYMTLDASASTITLARAGHPAALLFFKESKRCELALPSGVAIGISEPDMFEALLVEKKIALTPGDFIFLYTDGVDESCNEAKELFGHKRIVQCLEANAHLSAQEIVTRLDQVIKQFIQKAPQHDDMTMILVKREKA